MAFLAKEQIHQREPRIHQHQRLPSIFHPLFERVNYKPGVLDIDHLSTPFWQKVNLPTAATSHLPSWFVSLRYCTTSRALALSWILEFDPLNWNILDFVSKINMSSWLSDDRAKGTCSRRGKKEECDICVKKPWLYKHNLTDQYANKKNHLFNMNCMLSSADK